MGVDCLLPDCTEYGGKSKRVAEIIAAAVLSAELSLLASLSQHTVVSSHMKLNRGK